MRTVQLLFLVLFLAFYVLISLGTLKSLSRLKNLSKGKKLEWIVFVISCFVFLSFIFLYIWPMNTQTTKDYSLHLIFNAILSADLIFKIPLAFSYVIGIFFSLKQKPVIYSAGLILGIGMSSSVIYGSFMGTKELNVNQIELGFQNLPKNFDGYRILQLSDIHLGNFLNSKTLMQKVKNETAIAKPNIILFTGDLVNNFSNELDGWSNIFKDITSNTEGLSILGNHDYGDYTQWDNKTEKIENFNKIIAAHNTFGIPLLNNENIKIKSKTDSIYIIGVENWGHPPFPQYANLEKAMSGIPENSFKILLSHDPAHWDEIIKYREDIDLTLSGHTHGFQWGIKKAGITFSIGYLARKNWGGLYKYGKSQLFVNTGLGTVGIPWRINMSGELTLITLKRIEID